MRIPIFHRVRSAIKLGRKEKEMGFQTGFWGRVRHTDRRVKRVEKITQLEQTVGEKRRKSYESSVDAFSDQHVPNVAFTYGAMGSRVTIPDFLIEISHSYRKAKTTGKKEYSARIFDVANENHSDLGRLSVTINNDTFQLYLAFSRFEDARHVLGNDWVTGKEQHDMIVKRINSNVTLHFRHGFEKGVVVSIKGIVPYAQVETYFRTKFHHEKVQMRRVLYRKKWKGKRYDEDQR